MSDNTIKQQILDDIFSISDSNLELLRKQTFLKPLIKTMIRDKLVEKINLDEELNTKLSEDFFKSRNIQTSENQQAFLNKNLMDNEDLKRLSTIKHKSNQISLNLFGIKSEEVFNKKKEDLDKYRYSLIQVKDPDLAQELYLKLESKENEFSEIEAEHSIALEKNKKEFNDAVPLMRIHPLIRKILKSSELGIINEPVNLGEFWVIIRLDEIIQAEFNEKMKETLSKELFEIFLERMTQEIIDEIKKEKYQGKFN